MKQLFVLFLVFGLSACGHTGIFAPNLAKNVEGVYEVYLLGDGVNNKTMPSDGTSLKIELTPIDKATSSYLMTLTLRNDSDIQEGIFELKKSGDQINLHEDGKNIGFIKGSELSIDYVNGSGVRSVIKAKK